MERPAVPVYGKRFIPEVIGNHTTPSSTSELASSDTPPPGSLSLPPPAAPRPPRPPFPLLFPSASTTITFSIVTTLPPTYTEAQPTSTTVEIEPGLKLIINTSSSSSSEVTLFASSESLSSTDPGPTSGLEHTISPSPTATFPDENQGPSGTLPEWAIAIILAIGITAMCVAAVLIQSRKHRRVPPRRRRSINYGGYFMSGGSGEDRAVGQLSEYQLDAIQVYDLGALSPVVLSAFEGEAPTLDSTYSESMYSQPSA